ncbi:MAG: MATE family efflux transporter [Peptococcaceae bacterium]|jgi:putative MATE family efflux protein|nr:MATE family efflux transporter [Peptococcaceae bacterium]
MMIETRKENLPPADVDTGSGADTGAAAKAIAEIDTDTAPLAGDMAPLASEPVPPDAADRLGSEPVGRLLLRFSAPAITGMLVNALYNVVDRIFVGRGVGETALGGLTLVMPLMTAVMAFALLIGVGTANLISMRLGQRRRPEAERALNHCFWLLLGAGILVMIAGLLFLEPLLALLSAQEDSAAIFYARGYIKVILYGSVFWLMSFGLSHCARAQGFPAVSMGSMLIGTGMNCVLDPLFIFVFHWGVEGAALATVISWLASTVWILAFSLSKRAIISLRPLAHKFALPMARQIFLFGAAQFFLQLAVAFVQAVYNGSVSVYGAIELGGANGGDVALSGMNILHSIMTLILMPIFGINQGAQPILGYNYGAKKFARVLRAYIYAVLAATVVSSGGFLLSHIYPEGIVDLFAPNGSAALLAFAPKAIRTYTLALPLVGFQIVSANMFVVTGRPKTSLLLSMTRQLILLIPCILLFGWLGGLNGVLWATPTADSLSILLTALLIIRELRVLRRAASAL